MSVFSSKKTQQGVYAAEEAKEKTHHVFKLYDTVRIDHFRGFDEYYSIPFGDQTAERGHWEKGPGTLPFIAN